MRLNLKQGPPLLSVRDPSGRNLEIQEVGKAASQAQKQDRIHEFPFDPGLSYIAFVKQRDSAGDGTVTEEVFG